MEKKMNAKNLRLKDLIIIILPALIALIVLNCGDKSPKPSFRFVYMTDIHVQPENKADEGFKTAIAKVNELKPDFVITGGDLIMDALGQNSERTTMLYDMYLEICKDFQMPVYQTIGNHEVFGLYEESGIQPDHPDYGKKMYMKRMGVEKTYSSFDFNNWHFILLDGIGFTPERKYIGEIDSVQIEWLKNDLVHVDKQTPIVVSTHIPFVSVADQMRSGGTAALSPGAVIAKSNEILALFSEHNLKLVLQGHLHIVEEIIFQDTHFITGGAVSGKWWHGPRAGFPEGFVVLDVYEDNFDWHYQTYGWKSVVKEK